MHKDIDGKFNRYLELPTIRVSGIRDAGTGVTEWLVAGPFRVLEMRDPNSGIGWNPNTKPRHQYALLEAGPVARTLPPESVGDVWLGETEPPPFAACEVGAPGEYILRLLTESCPTPSRPRPLPATAHLPQLHELS